MRMDLLSSALKWPLGGGISQGSNAEIVPRVTECGKCIVGFLLSYGKQWEREGENTESKLKRKEIVDNRQNSQRKITYSRWL